MNNSTDEEEPILFEWNALSGVSLYHLQISESTDFSTVAFEDNNIATTSKSVTGLDSGTVYYWRVRGK